MTPLTKIEALRKLAEKATPAPWIHHYPNSLGIEDVQTVVVGVTEEGEPIPAPERVLAGPVVEGKENDMAFVAAIRNAFPALLAVAEAAAKCVDNPAWAGVCDEDVELERALAQFAKEAQQ